MDYRQGKCEQCGAEYDIPASFEHDAARCKVCEGMVRIAPAGGTKPATPIPAKPVQAKPAAEKKGGTLERLKAQRAAEAAAGSQTPAPKPAARPAAKAKAAPAAAAKSAGRPTRTGAKSSARSGAGRRGKGGDGDEEGSGRGRRGGQREKKGPPVGGLIAVGALVVLGGGAFLFRDTLFGSSEKVDAKESQEAATADGTTPADADTTPTDEGPEASEDTPPTPEVATPEPEPTQEPEAPKEVDPDSIDLLAEVPEFGPAFGTNDEEWTELQELVVTAFDSQAGAAEGRARKKLVAMKHKAFPVILNMMRKLDLKTADGARTGFIAQRELQNLAGGNNFDWRVLKQDQDAPLAKDVLFNKKVIQAWAKQWAACTDPATGVEYWIAFAKLEEKDKDEAGLLRELYGGDPAAAVSAGGGAVSDDDLDVD